MERTRGPNKSAPGPIGESELHLISGIWMPQSQAASFFVSSFVHFSLPLPHTATPLPAQTPLDLYPLFVFNLLQILYYYCIHSCLLAPHQLLLSISCPECHIIRRTRARRATPRSSNNNSTQVTLRTTAPHHITRKTCSFFLVSFVWLALGLPS